MHIETAPTERRSREILEYIREAGLDPDRMPRHIGIIMDGNGRWAQERGLLRTEGHKKGADAVDHAVRESRRLGIEMLTLYAFSADNWSRPQSEIAVLMTLLEKYARAKVDELAENGIRFRAIGDSDRLPPRVQHAIRECEEKTKHCKEMTLNVALSYSGRQEIVLACREAITALQPGEILTEEVISRHLQTPDADLIVRTSGEQRLSDFLPWQAAYAELIFVQKHWPDFDNDALRGAIREYQERNRRFGGVT